MRQRTLKTHQPPNQRVVLGMRRVPELFPEQEVERMFREVREIIRQLEAQCF